jgi:hypothetical protein
MMATKRAERRYWIVASAGKRLAAQQTPNRQHAAQERSVALDGLSRIVGAGGLKAARCRQHGREPALVEAQRGLDSSTQHSVVNIQAKPQAW